MAYAQLPRDISTPQGRLPFLHPFSRTQSILILIHHACEPHDRVNGRVCQVRGGAASKHPRVRGAPPAGHRRPWIFFWRCGGRQRSPLPVGRVGHTHTHTPP